MKKLVVFWVVAALSIFAGMANAENYLKTIKLSFIEAGQLASTVKDTMFVTDEADTARSTLIDISDLDWAATLAQGSVATGFPIAKVTFVATRASNGVGDTLYWNPERGIDVSANPSTSYSAARPDTIFSYNPLSLATGYGGTSSGWSALTSTGAATANQYNNKVYVGYIYVDPDTRDRSGVSGSNYMLKRFRLVTAGDVGGSSPVLSGVMGFITYLAKR